MLVAGIDWGPISAWVAAAVTFGAALIALLVAMGVFDSVRGPRIRITFEQTEPWCRPAKVTDGSEVLWVRVGVENVGRGPARGCVGRMISLTSDGVERPDVDPIQLRWAGVPRSRSFDPVDLRRDQREFLNVLVLNEARRWRLVTFEDPDFDPGFSTELTPDQQHVLKVAVFSDNADTTTRFLVAYLPPDAQRIELRLDERPSVGGVGPS
jgi:hypothetical protein